MLALGPPPPSRPGPRRALGAVALGLLTALLGTVWLPRSLEAYRGQPPAGRVALCGILDTCRDSGCHQLADSATLTWELRQANPAAPLPAYWSPGQALDLELAANDPAAGVMGFQITSVLPCVPPQPEQAGSFELLEPGRTTRVTDDFEIDYVTHACTCLDMPGCCGALSRLPGSGDYAWTFRWTPPPRGSGTAIFYLAINSADGDFSQAGDQISVGEVRLEEEPCPPRIDDLRVRIANCDPAAPAEPRVELWRESGGPMDIIREAGDGAELRLPASDWSQAPDACRTLWDGRSLVTWSVAPTCDLGGEGLH
jgi:hypothetical protein